MMGQPKENDAGSQRSRLREILAVLARHEVLKGLSPKKLRTIIEDLGPTFVKFGQLLSMRHDILPESYCNELSSLRMSVKPMNFIDVKNSVEREYGESLFSVFASFDKECIGSASIAQVHAAVLHDGRKVVVKVQREGIRETMSQDIRLLHRMARLFRLTEIGDVIDLHIVLDEMWETAQQEMDFLIEAKNADEFWERNRDVRFVSCPKIEHRLTTSRVLVMERIDGFAIDDVSALKAHGYDLSEIGAKLADNYVKQIIEDGFFHADPHPGNIRIQQGRIIWLDLGMMGRLSVRDQELLRNAVRAVARNDVDALKSTILALAASTGEIDHAGLRQDICEFLDKYGKMDIGNMDLGQIFNEMMSLARKYHIAMPKGISRLGRGALTLEGVLAVICPDINLVQIMGARLSADFLQELDVKQELRKGARRLYESGTKAIELPGQISDLLRMGIRGEAKLNLELLGSDQPLSKIDHMVNKLIKSLFAAFLFIGSSVLCTTDIKPQMLGIPILGLLGFSASFVLGLWVLWDMHKGKKK